MVKRKTLFFKKLKFKLCGLKYYFFNLVKSTVDYNTKLTILKSNIISIKKLFLS